MKRFRTDSLTRRSALFAAGCLASAPLFSGQAFSQLSLAPPPPAPRPGHPLWPMEGPPVLRGAVVAQRRRRKQVDGETFGGKEAALPAYGKAEFDALAKAGANLVVMSFPELWSVKPPYRPDPEMQALLSRQIEQASSAGLYVVVALRSGPGRSDFVFHREAAGSWFPAELIVDSIWTNAEEQAAWAEMCAATAGELARIPAVAGLNIMVEPDSNVGGTNRQGGRLDAWEPEAYFNQVSNASDWRRIAGNCARKVRGVAADLPILISPPAFGRTDFLPVMGQAPVPGCVWCIHDYEPRDYTHQPKDSKVELAEGDAGKFASRLAAAKMQGAPVFLGEFGAAHWAKDIESYFGARIAMCEGEGAAWAAFRWPTNDKDYEAKDDTFNVSIGPDGKTRGAALKLLREAWANNTMRPEKALRGRN